MSQQLTLFKAKTTESSIKVLVIESRLKEVSAIHDLESKTVTVYIPAFKLTAEAAVWGVPIQE